MKKAVVFFFLLFISSFCFSQNTYVPDDNFEQALIDLGYDSGPLDNYVPTINISSVTFLDVSSKVIFDLTGIEDFISLTVLSCFYNELTNLNVRQNIFLTYLNCDGNELTSLDVTNNLELDYLNIQFNEISNIDISKNTKLKIIALGYNQLTELDVSNNVELINLRCNDNQITDLNVQNNIGLTDLMCGDNSIKKLDLTQNIALTSLNCIRNQLISLDLTNNPLLTYLQCGSNPLTFLDVRTGNNMALTQFHSSNTPKLFCIFVDDSNYSTVNWPYPYTDKASTFVNTQTECDCIPPVIDEFDDVRKCGSYILPSLVNGNYFSETLGRGTQLSAGENIIISQTVYIYAEDTLDSSCYNESNFTIEIDPAIDFELTINNIEIDGYNILVTMSDNYLDYEYAVDDATSYQTSNLFFDLSEGSHILYVKDENGCVEKSIDFQIYSSDIMIPNFFTPNNDGENDYWEIIDIANIIESVSVFDRFGKILTTITPNAQGWNGYYNGQSMPSTDYWYTLHLFSGKTINGHFTLIRR